MRLRSSRAPWVGVLGAEQGETCGQMLQESFRSEEREGANLYSICTAEAKEPQIDHQQGMALTESGRKGKLGRGHQLSIQAEEDTGLGPQFLETPNGSGVWVPCNLVH